MFNIPSKPVEIRKLDTNIWNCKQLSENIAVDGDKGLINSNKVLNMERGYVSTIDPTTLWCSLVYCV